MVSNMINLDIHNIRYKELDDKRWKELYEYLITFLSPDAIEILRIQLSKTTLAGINLPYCVARAHAYYTHYVRTGLSKDPEVETLYALLYGAVRTYFSESRLVDVARTVVMVEGLKNFVPPAVQNYFELVQNRLFYRNEDSVTGGFINDLIRAMCLSEDGIRWYCESRFLKQDTKFDAEAWFHFVSNPPENVVGLLSESAKVCSAYRKDMFSFHKAFQNFYASFGKGGFAYSIVTY